MDQFEALRQARAEFEKRLRAVAAGQWAAPTPCEGWTVRDLAHHVVSANLVAVHLLDGLSHEQALAATADDVLGDDPVAAFVDSAEALAPAFGAEGALERTCRHRLGAVSGEMLLGFRVTDLTLHAWDLARGIGADEELDGELVATLWERMEPLTDFVVSMGVFGEGPSGTVGADAPVQTRLLDLSGRRP
jgi:uncharacterized protein (TIGR03086 family)